MTNLLAQGKERHNVAGFDGGYVFIYVVFWAIILW